VYVPSVRSPSLRSSACSRGEVRLPTASVRSARPRSICFSHAASRTAITVHTPTVAVVVCYRRHTYGSRHTRAKQASQLLRLNLVGGQRGTQFPFLATAFHAGRNRGTPLLNCWRCACRHRSDGR